MTWFDLDILTVWFQHVFQPFSCFDFNCVPVLHRDSKCRFSIYNLAGSLSCVRSLSCTRLRCTSCFLCLARSTLPYLLRLLSASWFVIVFEFYTRFRYCCLGHCCKWLSFVQLTVQSLSAIEIVCIVCASPRCLGWKVRESRLCLRDARGVVRLWELIRTWCDLIRLSFDLRSSEYLIVWRSSEWERPGHWNADSETIYTTHLGLWPGVLTVAEAGGLFGQPFLRCWFARLRLIWNVCALQHCFNLHHCFNCNKDFCRTISVNILLCWLTSDKWVSNLDKQSKCVFDTTYVCNIDVTLYIKYI